jgi:hypothetical protein
LEDVMVILFNRRGHRVRHRVFFTTSLRAKRGNHR